MSPKMPTLFLPGAGGRRAFWEPVAARLAHAKHPLFFAWPGFGDEPPEPRVRSLDDLYEWFIARAPKTPSNVVAQSMGGVIAMRFAIEQPQRVQRLVLTATSGGTSMHVGVDWRPGFRAEHPEAPDWFERDQTDLEARLGQLRAPTLLLFGDADPIAPLDLGERLRSRLNGAHLVVVRGGSHGFAEERPDEVARLIDEHFAASAPAAFLTR